MKEDWVKQLRDKLADYEEPAPADMWAQIEARLSQSDAAAQPARKPRLVSVWAKYIAVAAVFVGMMTCSGYLLWRISNEEAAKDRPQMASNKIVPEKHDKVPMESGKSMPLELAQPLLARKVQPVETLQRHQPQETPAKQQEMTTVPDHVASQNSIDEHERREEKPFEVVQEQEQLLRELDEQIAQSNSKQTRGRVGFGLYAQNGFGNESSANGVLMSPQLAANYDFRYHLMGLARTRGDAELIYLANYEERQKHYQPISFGLSVNLPISSRVSLATGLVYTRLRSDFTVVMSSYPMTTEQTLYYLGVPLNVHYRIWGYKGLKVYGIAGAAADYNVKARQELEGVKQDMSRDRWQFSLNGGLGIEYDVIPQLGIYVEPGVKYYFDNGSRVQTFFKDKPTNFNLQVGLRWNLRN
ncbi:MAG: PorT family protein [Prevotella sp.]|nr:PorT family protein [Prevotella sp.]